MTNYTFSVVANNTIDNVEAGVVIYTTPGKAALYTCSISCNYCLKEMNICSRFYLDFR